MKIRTRLFAGLLSFVLGISAVPFPASASSASHQRDEETGDVAMEGRRPEVTRQVINVTFPTTNANFILDPNRLILNHLSDRDTQNIKVTDNGVLFANRDSDGNVTGYSGTSDPVTVHNSTPAPVVVKMTVSVNSKPGTNPDFTFAYTRDFRDKDGKEIDGRAIYLAIVNEGREIPVQPDGNGYTAVIEGWIENDERLLSWEASSNRYEYKLKDANKAYELRPGTSFYMTGDATPGNWSDVADLNAQITWEAVRDTFGLEDTPNVDREPSVKLVTAATAPGQWATLLADFGSGDEERTQITRFVYKDSTGATKEILPDSSTFVVDDTTVRLKVSQAIFDATQTWIEFAGRHLDPADSTKLEKTIQVLCDVTSVPPSVELVTAAEASGQQATLTVDYGSGNESRAKVNRLVYVDSTGTTQYARCTVSGTGKTTVTVTVARAIWEATRTWIEFTDTDGSNAILVPCNLRTSENPSIISQTRVMHPDEDAVVKVDFGKGAAKMQRIIRLEYNDADGVKQTVLPTSTSYPTNLSVNDEDKGNIATIKMVEEIYIGTDWTLVLTSHDGKSTYSLPLDIRDPDSEILESEGVRVTVDTYATAVNGKAELTLNYGKGAYKMDKVVSLTYVRSDTDAEVNIAPGSTAFKITNTTKATVTASAVIFNAKSWKIVFGKNGSDETYDVDFTLCSIDPSVKVTTLAAAEDESTVLELDFGRGPAAATEVKALRCTLANGSKVDIPASGNPGHEFSDFGITVEDNVMTIPMEEMDIGDNEVWSIVFDNDFECPFEIFRVNRNPSVKVITPAEKSGDVVSLELDYGSGDLAATAVSGLQYVRSDTGATVTLKVNSANFKMPDGNTGKTATVTAFPLCFNGRAWYILFNNGYQAEFSLISKEPSIIEVTKATALNGTATVEFDWGNGTSQATSVAMTYTDAGGGEHTLNDGDNNFAVNGTTATITAVSAIYNAVKWKLLFTRNDDDSYSVEEEFDAVEMGEYPEITEVVSTDATTGTATITFDLGSGRRAATRATGLKYLDANGTAQNLSSGFTSNGTTASVTFTESLANVFSVVETWYLVFDTGYELESTEKLYDTSVYPSVRVNNYATAIGDVVSLTIDYGRGEKAATSVTGLKYIRSDTGATVTLKVNSTYFKMPDGATGTTATLTAFALCFNAKAWYIIFDNGYEVRFGIFWPGPAITSVTPADNDISTASIVYTLGKDGDAASALTGLRYGTQPVRPASNNYNTDENSGTATFTVTDAMKSVTDWALVFDNTIEIKSNEPLYCADEYPDVTVNTYAEEVGQTASLTLSYGTGSRAATAVTSLQYVRSDTGATVTLKVNSANFKMPGGATDTTATVTAFPLLFEAKEWYIVFDDGSASGYRVPFTPVAKTASVSVTETAGSVGATASLTYNLGSGSKVTTGVKSLKYVPQGTDTPVTIAANAANFTVNTESKTITVTAVSAIYNAESWAVVFDDNTESECELVILGEYPDITAVTPVERVGETATVTIDPGSGRRAATNVTSLKYTDSNGRTQTLTSGFSLSGNTLSVTVTDALSTVTEWSLVFNNAESTEVSGTGSLYVMNVPPSVKVNNYAEASGDVVSLTLNFGSGNLAASSVTGLQYIRSDTGATVTLKVNSANFKMPDGNPGASATVTAFPLLFNAKAWYIVFNTQTVEFSIFTKGPAVESVTPAADVGQTAAVTFSWGEEEAAATGVTGLQYLSANGQTVTLDSSKLSVSGTTATVTVTQELSETSKWWLVFNNDAKAESTESLIVIPDIDPTLEVLTTPDAIGDVVSLSLDFGSGAGKATSVTGLQYVRSDTGATVTLKVNSANFKMPDGNPGTSATITAFALLYNAKAWYLVFNNQTVEFDLFTAGSYPDPRGKAPSVKAVTPADAVGSTATITVNLGTGERAADNVASLKYVDSNSQTQTLTSGFSLDADGTSLSVTVTEALSNASAWSVVFNNTDRTEVSRTNKLLSRGPSVTVNTRPGAVNETGALTLDFGDPPNAATSVTGLQYVRSDTGATVTLNVNSTNFKVANPNSSGTTATVTAFPLLYEAKNWYIVFNNKTVEFELVTGIEEAPEVTSVSAATAVGGNATIVYDPGRGSITASGITSLTYTGGSGQKTLTPGNGMTVNAGSHTITIPATADMANLTGWTLTFNNTAQTTVQGTEELLSTSQGPSVTVVTQASAIGQVATLTLDYGTGSLAATGLKKLSYYKNGTTWIDISLAPITNTNITLSGNTMTIKAFTYLYNASGWKIEFNNGQEAFFNPTNRTV